ncbi:MAG: dTDP-4-dehydrorhamnose reductase [Rhodothermales bacterium]
MLYRRVLITGANGLLGQALVRWMCQFPQYDVLATGRDAAPRFPRTSCGYTPFDITNDAQRRQLFLDFTPDVVVNCAAMTQVDTCETERQRCWQINVDAVTGLAQQCLQHGAKLIQVSTDFIFDGEDGPYTEKAHPIPVNYYGKSKLAAENAVRGAGLDQWGVTRTILLYGTAPGLSRSNIVLWVVDKLTKGEPIHVVTDQWRTPTYAPDLAEGIERMIRFDKYGTYHLSGREFLSIYDFALLIADVFELDASLVHPTDRTRFQQAACRPARTGFVTLKAETELDYAPLSVRDGLLDLRRRLGQAPPVSTAS